MITIELLLCFIFGMVFNQWIFPVLDALTTWFQTWCEARKSKTAIVIAKNNDFISKITDPPEHHNCIGFMAPLGDDEDFDEEEEGEDEEE